MLDIAERIVAFAAGIAIVIGTFLSAVRTFVLPRSSPTILTRVIFLTMRDLFSIFEKRATTYEQRDRILALYAPLSLLVMPPVWLICVLTGFMGMFWAVGGRSWYEALRISGSSLLTLGFVPLDRLVDVLLGYSEATLGLIMVALLIAYLPSMYSAFQKRETAVTLLEVRAGAPPSAIELFQRFQRLGVWKSSASCGSAGRSGLPSWRKATPRCRRWPFFVRPSLPNPGSRPPARCWMRPRWPLRRWISRAMCRPICASAPATWRCGESAISSRCPTTRSPRPATRSA